MSRVLVVEDNPASLKLVRDLLEQAGHLVTAVMDGALAIEAVREHRPDLVVMDINLRGTDGLSIARALRSSSDTQNLPLMAVTALAMPEDEARVLAAGFDAYLPKPIAYREFLRRVEGLLSHSGGGS